MKCPEQKFVAIFHVEKLSAIIASTFVPGQVVKWVMMCQSLVVMPSIEQLPLSQRLLWDKSALSSAQNIITKKPGQKMECFFFFFLMGKVNTVAGVIWD